MRVDPARVHSTEVDGVNVLLDTATSQYMALSTSAALLFEQLTRSECTEDDLVDALVARYAIDPVVARRDVEVFIHELRRRGVLSG